MNRTLGVSLKVENAGWYNSSYGFNIINTLMANLTTFKLHNVANATATGIPIMFTSSDPSTLM